MCNGWEAAGAGSFDSVSALTAAASTARSAGDVAKEPNLNATYEALPASAKGKGNAKFKATVPVWIHVISDGATGDIPQSRDRRADGGAEHGLRRLLRRGRSRLHVQSSPASPGPTTPSGTTLVPGGNAEHDMKQTLHRVASRR